MVSYESNSRSITNVDVLQEFVGGELNGGEGNSHGKSGRVGNVESAESLCPVYSFKSFGNTSEFRSMNLHSLLDDCRESRKVSKTCHAHPRERIYHRKGS